MRQADLKTPIAKRWAKIASNPNNEGTLVIMLSGASYFLIGDDAAAASEALGLPLDGISDPMFSFPRDRITAYAAQLRDKGLRVIICGHHENSDTSEAFWRATVEVIIGDQKVSNFMSRVGLGITGAGTKHVLTLNYEPGADVDTERVNAAIENMKSIADTEDDEFVILSHKLLTLELITPQL